MTSHPLHTHCVIVAANGKREVMRSTYDYAITKQSEWALKRWVSSLPTDGGAISYEIVPLAEGIAL